MIFSNDESLLEGMKEIRNHGAKSRYYHVRIGINGRLDTIQAAILLGKFPQFELEVEKRANAGASYTRKINAINKNIITPEILPGNTSVFAQYTVQVNEREKIAEELRKKGIPTTVHYPTPLHMQPAIKNQIEKPTDCRLPITEAAAKRVLSLPMHPYLSESDIEKIVSILNSAVDKTAELEI